ncbi:circadian clock-controlled protein daywake-like isoform X1 [Drosophila willistoni]|uniref:circadian clock-controlled protein daywake-like isoform X1 n=1 Tax=Drosophila willistoni TaxID=7260 RepID=UPI000C26D6D0|nr:circadian clock-controlled protein daywake-like isoform X1 [Drosophila willistoni]XP_046865326.1 circadian clock-controlled protein daywake-like isoform X1 [Drosophila willistoni]
MENSWIIFILAALQMTQCFQLRSDIRRCQFSDDSCITNSMNYVLRRYGKIGMPELKFPPLTSAKVDDLEVVENDKKKLIWYHVKGTNMMAYGLENTTITKVKTDWKQKSLDIYGHIPNLMAKMNYSIKTRILSFALQSTGHGSVAVKNLRFLSRSSFIIDNRGYVKIYRLAVHTKIDRPVFDLTYVNEDNTDLAIVLNDVINENWQDVWAEVNPVFENMLQHSFITHANNIFSSATYMDLFLPEDEDILKYKVGA